MRGRARRLVISGSYGGENLAKSPNRGKVLNSRYGSNPVETHDFSRSVIERLAKTILTNITKMKRGKEEKEGKKKNRWGNEPLIRANFLLWQFSAFFFFVSQLLREKKNPPSSQTMS